MQRNAIAVCIKYWCIAVSTASKVISRIPVLDQIIHEKPIRASRLKSLSLVSGLSDTRGLKNDPQIALNGSRYEFKQNSGLEQVLTWIARTRGISKSKTRAP